MNAPFDPGAHQSFGAPPQPPGGLKRLTGMLKAAAGGSVLIMVGMYASQLFMPARYTPATVTGQAAAQTEVADIELKQKVKTAYEAGLAEAQMTAQARGQIEIETSRQQQQLRADSLSMQSNFANLADLGCFAGAAIEGLAGPDNKDLQQQGAAIAHLTCGAGDALRDNITKQQAEAARTGGAVMNRNTYGQAAAPQPVITQPPVERPSHRYSEEEQAKLAPLMQKMPAAVKASLWAGLNFKNQTDVDILCDRVVAYLAAHPEYAAG